jgi:hypothetical protein
LGADKASEASALGAMYERMGFVRWTDADERLSSPGSTNGERMSAAAVDRAVIASRGYGAVTASSPGVDPPVAVARFKIAQSTHRGEEFTA